LKVERKTDVGDEIRVGDEADRDGSFASIGQKTARKRAVLSGFEICRAACGEAVSTYCGEVVSKFYLYFQAVLGLTVEVIEKDINRLRVIIG